MKKEFTQSIKIIILGLVLSLGLIYVSAWIGPSETVPLVNNIFVPLNESNFDQIKNGSLWVNVLGVFGDASLGGDVTLNYADESAPELRELCAGPPDPEENNRRLIAPCSVFISPVPIYHLSVDPTPGTGSGTVTVTSPDYEMTCEESCGKNYDSGTPITLVANESPGSDFTEWGGDGTCSGINPTCVINGILLDVNVIARFNPEDVELTVRIVGTGSGKVVSTPAGINCFSGTCIAEFNFGEVVRLRATKTGSVSSFTRWVNNGTEACSGTERDCYVTMDEPQSAIARFSGSSGGSGGEPVCGPGCTFVQDSCICW